MKDKVIAYRSDIVDIADAVRGSTGKANEFTLSEIVDEMNDINSEIDVQTDLVDQIRLAIADKAAGSANIEMCAINLNILATNSPIHHISYTTVLDGKPSICNVLNDITANTTINVVKNSVIYVWYENTAITSDNIIGIMDGAENRPLCFNVVGDGSITVTAPCFVRNTLIALANGESKVVQDVTYDDVLLVWDFDNGCYTSAKPLWIKRAQTSPYYYNCKFENGMTLQLVGTNGKCHRIFNIDDNCFESATDCVGKMVMTERGATRLMACDRVDETVEFYNIITDYHLNLFANSVLTSCRLNNLYPIQQMRFVKEDRPEVLPETYNNIDDAFYRGLRLSERNVEAVDELNAYVALMNSLMVPKEVM